MIELILIDDVFQITNRGSVLAGCFKGTPNDERLKIIIGATLLIKDIHEQDIVMKAIGLDIMRNHYIDWSNAKEFHIGVLVDKHITLDQVKRYSPVFIAGDSSDVE